MAAIKGGGELDALHEDCIAYALSLTTPKDACRLSLVDSMFRSAARSDVVWERFLPSDYRDLISRSSDGPDSPLNRIKSKKELYLYLCHHSVLIDGGLKSFSLDKLSGKKCYMLSARDLFIVRGDAPEYLRWIPESRPVSRFSEVIQLLNVHWFEIRGKMNMSMLSLGTNYAAYLVFTCTSVMHVPQADAYVGMISTVRWNQDGFKRQKCQIVQIGVGQFRAIREWEQDEIGRDTQFPKKRSDGWMEVELGELFVKGGEEGELEMNLMDSWGGNLRSGLIIQGIEIRPKESQV